MLTDLGCKVASFSSTNVSEVDTIVDEIKDNNASFALSLTATVKHWC